MRTRAFDLTRAAGLVVFLWLTLPGHADRIQLKDGTTLRCKVLNETESKESGTHYLQIQINKSLVWLNREFVERIEKTPDSMEEDGLGVHDLIQQMIRDGKLVPDLQKQLDFVTAPPPAKTEIPFQVKTVEGWAYLYKDQQAIDNRERAPLKEGREIPNGYMLILSPNTHVTLSIGDIGEMGLEGGTQIRFDDVVLDRSTQSYRMDLRMNEGRGWIHIDTPNSSWKKVIFSINTVRCVLQSGTLYIEASGKIGEVDITYIQGKSELNFWRGNEGPFMVSTGQVLKVSPSTAKLPVDPASRLADVEQKLAQWTTWKPEPFAVDLKEVMPPFNTFPSYGVLPALHAHEIPLDHTMTLPPLTKNLGEILAEYKKAVEKYKYETGKYPHPDQGVDALFASFDVAGWRGPYLPLDIPKNDLWGEKFVYSLFQYQGKEYPDIRSKGPNKKDDQGLGDDIR